MWVGGREREIGRERLGYIESEKERETGSSWQDYITSIKQTVTS